ncbi:unnamed protein product [Gemmata obscuriglobus UQM 2246]|nr:unnamed protein product [Gemmata obscuriglobus UQM 2246]
MPGATPTKPVRIPPTVIGAGVLIVLLGFGLPSLFSVPSVPTAPQTPQAATKAEAPPRDRLHRRRHRTPRETSG